jgi:micrococcal nuclease
MRVFLIVATLASLAAGLLVVTALHSDELLVPVVIDGDTIRAEEEHIRLLGLDAAEIHHAQCEAERRLGVLAKHRLEQLLKTGPVEIRRADPPYRIDRYGRTLAHVLINGEDVACVLIREGYARPWRGRPEDWCKGLDLPTSAESEPACPAIY